MPTKKAKKASKKAKRVFIVFRTDCGNYVGKYSSYPKALDATKNHLFDEGDDAGTYYIYEVSKLHEVLIDNAPVIVRDVLVSPLVDLSEA